MEAGGTQALLMNIYRKIDRTKLQFDFLVEYSEKQFYDDEITAMGGHVYYTSIREDYNVFKFRHQLKKFFKEHKEYKVVHVHAYTIGFLCLDIIKKAGIPVRIAHSHNNETVHDAKWLIKLCMQKLYTINATDLFACSQEAGADIKVTSTISTNANKAGSNVMLAATATGGNGRYTYKFIVYNKNTTSFSRPNDLTLFSISSLSGPEPTNISTASALNFLISLNTSSKNV
jgi:hypothetical protein